MLQDPLQRLENPVPAKIRRPKNPGGAEQPAPIRPRHPSNVQLDKLPILHVHIPDNPECSHEYFYWYNGWIG